MNDYHHKQKKFTTRNTQKMGGEGGVETHWVHLKAAARAARALDEASEEGKRWKIKTSGLRKQFNTGGKEYGWGIEDESRTEEISAQFSTFAQHLQN